MSYQNRYTDRYSESQSVIDTVNAHLHEGRVFSATEVVSIPAASPENFLIKVPSAAVQLAPPHGVFRITASGTVVFVFYEGAIVAADGTELSKINRSRLSPRTSQLGIFNGTTISNDGVQLLAGLLLGGSPASSGVSASFENEVIGNFDTNYLLRVTNTGGSAVDVALQFTWYEGAGY